MIKKISIDQLKIGLYLNDINCEWGSHSFDLNCFMVDDAITLRKIIETGVKEVFIDTSLGADVLAEDANTIVEDGI